MPGFADELNKIYVLRRIHRQGIGRLLPCNVARRFLQQGVTSMLLFGEATCPSNGFYEAFGAERLYNCTTTEVGSMVPTGGETYALLSPHVIGPEVGISAPPPRPRSRT